MKVTGPSKGQYRADIDGLRAVAVLLVLASHFAPVRFPRAFVGVDIFFVISGFVITGLIYHEGKEGSFRLADFWYRRILRLFPALLVLLPLVLLAGWFVLLPSAYADLGFSIAAGAGLGANFLELRGSYWALDAAFVPLEHLWSLAVEEQFYLCYPPLLLLAWRWKGEQAVKWFIALLGLASIVSLWHLRETNLVAAYFLPISRIWEMLLGAALAWFGRGGALTLPNRPGLKSVTAAIGLGLIVAAIEYPLSAPSRFSWPLIVPFACMGAFMVILAGPGALPNRYLLSNPPMLFIGRISYGLYLWHWPPLVLLRQWTGEKLVDRPTGLVLLALAFAAASLSYFLIEQPFRRTSPARRGRVAQVLAGGLAAVAVAGGIVWAAGGFPGRFSPAVQQVDVAWASRGVPPSVRCFRVMEDPPEKLPAMCEQHRSPAARTAVAFWGDSHVGVLEAALRVRARKDGVAISIYSRGACPPLLYPAAQSLIRCRRFNETVFAHLKANPPDLVVLAAHWDANCRPSGIAPDCAIRLPETIQRLRAAGVRHVLVLGDTPFWSKPVSRLLIPGLLRHPEASVPQYLDRHLLVNHDQTHMRAVSRDSGAAFLPLLPELCSAERCRIADGGHLLQADTDHLTQPGVRYVLDRVWPKILAAAATPP
ncbi:MAG: acyltransferase family protein [Rhizomicrobium sp.]|nr:acyltransferase family protein [Rhizomicrobium sp.]